jgi:hypothetical protein
MSDKEDDDGADTIQYGDLLALQDEPAEGPDNPLDADELQTLLELQEGNNKPTATMLISDACFLILTISNFTALRLCNSSGGPHPRIFSAETREYMQKEQVVNIGIGNGAAFLHEGDTDEENVSNDDDDVNE